MSLDWVNVYLDILFKSVLFSKREKKTEYKNVPWENCVSVYRGSDVKGQTGTWKKLYGMLKIKCFESIQDYIILKSTINKK